MIILGIDPGYGITGFGVIEKTNDGVRCLDYGVIETPKNETLPVRLAMLYESLVSLIKKYKVDEIALEELFFAACRGGWPRCVSLKSDSAKLKIAKVIMRK